MLRYIARFIVVGSAKSCSQTFYSPLNRIKTILQTNGNISDININLNIKNITTLWKGNLINTIKSYLN